MPVLSVTVPEESAGGGMKTANDSSIQNTATFSLRTISGLVLKEARAVSAWMFGATFLRVFLKLLIQISQYRQDCVGDDTCTSQIPRNWFLNLSVLAEAVLWACPPKTLSDQAPGFVYASFWLLILVRNIFGVFPNMVVRVCEMSMGRLTLTELLVLLPVHLVCVLSTVVTLQKLLPESANEMGFGAIEYASNDPVFMIFGREVFCNTAFCVLILVVPEIMKINRISQWISGLVLYPIYNFGVDSLGMGCVFGPNVLFAFWAISETSSFPSYSTILGAICGGALGGYIMKQHFPDDQKM